jgi:hypothetical protein
MSYQASCNGYRWIELTNGRLLKPSLYRPPIFPGENCLSSGPAFSETLACQDRLPTMGNTNSNPFNIGDLGQLSQAITNG